MDKLGHIEDALARRIPPEWPLPPALATPTVEQPDENYEVFTIDLTVAHTDEPLGLAKSDIVGRNLTVIKRDSAFTIRLNSKGNTPISCEKGTEIENFKLTEIFYTNAALAGTAEIFVSWR